ncbi:MAG: RNA polymerase sigma factor [Oscillospiraceae bacterium]|nr:RNA polymerase sigma factor [Oscillospiraceae bacterium]
MQNSPEKLLVWRAIHLKDRKAADKLVEMHYREIYAYAYRQTIDTQLAMDLTQEIFISVLQSLENYEPKKASFRTWLYRIASCRITDYYRSRSYRQKKLTQTLGSILPPSDDGMALRLERKDSVQRVLELMENCQPETRQVLQLKLFAGQTFLQISDALSMPESTVKSRYYTAVKQIREKMEESL